MCDTAAVHLGVEPLIHFDSGDGFVMVVVITRPQKIRVVEELILFEFRKIRSISFALLVLIG